MREQASKKNYREEVGGNLEYERQVQIERLNSAAVAEYSVQMTYLNSLQGACGTR